MAVCSRSSGQVYYCYSVCSLRKIKKTDQENHQGHPKIKMEPSVMIMGDVVVVGWKKMFTLAGNVGSILEGKIHGLRPLGRVGTFSKDTPNSY